MAWIDRNTPKALADAMSNAAEKVMDRARDLTGRNQQEAFLTKLGEMSKYTPDVGHLERVQRWLLFVPDECMKSHRDHARLGHGARHIGEAFTVEKFTLWKQRGLKLSTVIPLRYQCGEESMFMSPRVAVRYPIRGELFFVSAQTLIKLDHHRENGVRFVRERVKVQIPTTKIQLTKKPLTIEKGASSDIAFVKQEDTVFTANGSVTPAVSFVKEENRVLGDPIPVWMYVGDPEYWVPLLDNGHTFALVRRFAPHNPLLSTYYHFTPEEYEPI